MVRVVVEEVLLLRILQRGAVDVADSVGLALDFTGLGAFGAEVDAVDPSRKDGLALGTKEDDRQTLHGLVFRNADWEATFTYELE